VSRTYLGRLIRAEHHIERNSSAYRRLDRCLKKSFDEDAKRDKLIEDLKKDRANLKMLETYIGLCDVVETKEDYQRLQDLLETIREEKRLRDLLKQQEHEQAIMDEMKRNMPKLSPEDWQKSKEAF
jgi:hypothetical protein